MHGLKPLMLALVLMAPVACGPSALARNTATVSEMLQRSGTPDFENASTEARPALRHTPSGMVCEVPSEGAFDFGVFPAAATNPGAHCSMVAGNVATMLMAVRFAEGTTLDAAFQNAVNSTAGQANAQPWRGQPSTADRSSPEGLTHFRIARFEANLDGAPHYLRIAMSEADGWYVQQIVSAPLDQAEQVEARAGEEWRAMLRDFAVYDER